ncbi:MAG: AgmX/PglI C-terminal domain-containing protein [Bdellovibrionaceae bacterium]|nr:AgmX/PglI C-terminal domain-containing protein [Pseudobdellovibrionaceae bacterium]
MRTEQYLFKAKVGDAVRRVLWIPDHPMAVDAEDGWHIEETEAGVLRAVDLSILDDTEREEAAIVLESLAPSEHQTIQLPAPQNSKAGGRAVELEIARLPVTKPPYQYRSEIDVLAPWVPLQIFLFNGFNNYLMRYRPVGNHRVISVNSEPIFTYTKKEKNFIVTVHKPNFRAVGDTEELDLRVGVPVSFEEDKFFNTIFQRGPVWWKFTVAPTPNGIPPIEVDQTEEDAAEKMRFENTLIFVSVFLLITFFVGYAVEKLRPTPPPPKVVAEVKVAKVIPKKLEPPKEKIEPPKPPPPPPPPPKKVEPPPPPPKKVEPVKPKKEPPKPKQSSAPAPKKPPPKQGVSSASPSSKEPPPKGAPPKVDEGAQALKSLGFLSNAPVNAVKAAGVYSPNASKRYGTKDAIVGKEISNVLGKPGAGKTAGGSIETKSSRAIGYETGIERGKGLNEVQGKVTQGELYNPGGSVGGSLSGGGSLSVSGPGLLSEAEIEKALAKFLSKFQYCYEKVLLTDSGASGNVVLQWTIQPSGSATDIRIVKTQIKNASLQGCISNVLKDIPFPRPKGGSVTAKKTLSFSSSTL